MLCTHLLTNFGQLVIATLDVYGKSDTYNFEHFCIELLESVLLISIYNHYLEYLANPLVSYIEFDDDTKNERGNLKFNITKNGDTVKVGRLYNITIDPKFYDSKNLQYVYLQFLDERNLQDFYWLSLDLEGVEVSAWI